MITATFQRLHVLVILDINTPRVVHWNLTDHSTAEWTVQQFRNGLPRDGAFRFLVHRDGIFAPAVDETLRSMSLQVLKTNAYAERVIGSIRRECLDHVIVANAEGLLALTLIH